MKPRLLGVVVALALAGLGTFLLVGYVRGVEQSVADGQRTVDVLVVSEPVAQGTFANDLKGKVRTERIPAKVHAVDAVATLDELQGQVALVNLVPGEQLVSTRFAAPESLEESRQVEVPAGLLEVTISLAPQRAVGGQLRPGSTVAVIASFSLSASGQDGEETQAQASNTTHVILHKALITNIQTERLPPAREEGSEDDSYTHELAPSGNFLITLAVDTSSAERIVFSAEFGTLWLAIQPLDAPEVRTEIQTRESIYQE